MRKTTRRKKPDIFEKCLGVKRPPETVITLSKTDKRALFRAGQILTQLRELTDQHTGEECTDTQVALAADTCLELSRFDEVKL